MQENNILFSKMADWYGPEIHKAWNKEALYMETHDTEFKQVESCCGAKEAFGIYGLLARFDMDRLICKECKEKEEEADDAEDAEEVKDAEETKKEKKNAGYVRPDYLGNLSKYEENYIGLYPYLDTDEIKEYIIENPGCLIKTNEFIGLSPMEYLERLYNSTELALLCPFQYTSLVESHRGDYVLDALNKVRAFCEDHVDVL